MVLYYVEVEYLGAYLGRMFYLSSYYQPLNRSASENLKLISVALPQGSNAHVNSLMTAFPWTVFNSRPTSLEIDTIRQPFGSGRVDPSSNLDTSNLQLFLSSFLSFFLFLPNLLPLEGGGTSPLIPLLATSSLHFFPTGRPRNISSDAYFASIVDDMLVTF